MRCLWSTVLTGRCGNKPGNFLKKGGFFFSFSLSEAFLWPSWRCRESFQDHQNKWVVYCDACSLGKKKDKRIKKRKSLYLLSSKRRQMRCELKRKYSKIWAWCPHSRLKQRKAKQKGSDPRGGRRTQHPPSFQGFQSFGEKKKNKKKRQVAEIQGDISRKKSLFWLNFPWLGYHVCYCLHWFVHTYPRAQTWWPGAGSQVTSAEISRLSRRTASPFPRQTVACSHVWKC